MPHPPPTARSEISSNVSEDDLAQLPQATNNQMTSHASAPVTQHGYAHLRGVTHPTNRSVRSPPPPPVSTGTSSRPQSPINQTSRTHVPSITAQGFLRPMSSRKLQAQRLGRTQRDSYIPPPTTSAGNDGADDSRSVTSSRQGPYASLPRSHMATPSVNTAYSESEAPENYGHIPGAYPSEVENSRDFFRSSSPTRRKRQTPLGLNLQTSLRVGSIREDIKSPRSFRSTLSFGSKHVFEPGHQHLSSIPNTPKQDEKIAPIISDKGNGKNFEYFEGNTIFWWGGRIQNARDRPINVATGVCIVLPNVLFFVFSASWLWHHVSPAVPVLLAYLFFICFSSFLHASLVDPGIIPRNIHPFPPESGNPLDVGPPTNDWVMVRLAGSDTAAMDVPVKYCKSCNIWRPPRCYHCRVCDNCVETLDHHCVWLNNCVGRRNYRYFFTFVSSGTVLALYLAFASLGHVISYSSQMNVSFRSAINSCRVPFAMFIYGILAMAYPSALWFYHLMLTGRGETTREYLSSRRFPKEERHRPFTLGNIFKNWTAVFARPKPPTYLHFKKAYEQGDQRFGSRRGQRQARLVSEAQGGGMEMKPVSGQRGFEGPTGRTKKEPK